MKKTALVTGASKRVGKAIVEMLASNGWSIIIHYNTSEKEAEVLEEMLEEKYPEQNFYRLKADLAKEEEVETLIPGIIEKSGPFHLLVNNASLFDRGNLADTEIQLFNSQMDVNYKAPFILIRDFARYCKKGNIINLVDTRITTNNFTYAAYSLSKKALWELTKMAALEYAPDIMVNAIAPGMSIPPEGKSYEYLERLATNIPAGKPVGLEPILKGIEYIVKSKGVTGQLLFADGGEHLGLKIK